MENGLSAIGYGNRNVTLGRRRRGYLSADAAGGILSPRRGTILVPFSQRSMKRLVTLGLAVPVLASSLAGAQNPLRYFTEGIEARFASSQPQLHYTLEIREGDTT